MKRKDATEWKTPTREFVKRTPRKIQQTSKHPNAIWGQRPHEAQTVTRTINGEVRTYRGVPGAMRRVGNSR